MSPCHVSGKYLCRCNLRHGAGVPGFSHSHVLVPLRGYPEAEVFAWNGDHIQTLGHQELGLTADAQMFSISPVHNDMFSVPAHDHGKHVCITYQV